MDKHKTFNQSSMSPEEKAELKALRARVAELELENALLSGSTEFSFLSSR